jgi:hypothetical protein
MNKRAEPGYPDPKDFAATDTLPMPILDGGDDTLASGPPAEAKKALPVQPADLAQTLRERERLFELATQRIAALEAELAAANHRCAELQAACDRLRDGRAPAVRMDDLMALRRQNELLHEAISSTQGQLAMRESMLAEAEEALGAALAARPAPAGPLPPGQGPDWQARCVELDSALQAERAGAAARVEAQEMRFAAIEAELAAVRGQMAGAPGATEEVRVLQMPRPIGSALRVLVRDEGGAEVVYPLGRHTTIGRTPDNDIQVNTTFVSRHHAVLLAGLDHCIVEDLNSTNGLQVNGQRVGRQLLHDGDIVTIGKTHFRYQTRS